MGAALQDVNVNLETAEGQKIACNDVIESALQRVLQSRPGRYFIVVLMDIELKQ